MTLLIMTICTVLFEKLYAILRYKEPRSQDSQFFLQNVQNNEIFDIFKMFKNNSSFNVYYTKSKRSQSLDCLFCFQLEISFLGKFSTFELKFRTRLIWTCRIILKICGVHFSYFRPEKSFSTNLVKKIKIVSLRCNLVSRLI